AEVKTPGGVDFRPDLTPREYVTLAGGPTNRAKVRNVFVTFRNGKTYAMADAPPLEPGAVVTVPEVAVKWWQDYVAIAQVLASLVTAYTGIFIPFNGLLKNDNVSHERALLEPQRTAAQQLTEPAGLPPH